MRHPTGMKLESDSTCQGSPPAPLHERTRSRALVAWRLWGVAETEEGLRLRSPYRYTIWPLREPLAAECLSLELARGAAASPHDPPGKGCQCGVYGSTYDELRRFLRANLARRSSASLLGRVLLWGEVLREGPAWRASRAYPEQLLVPTLTRRAFAIANALEAYEVRVDILDVGETFSALTAQPHVAAGPRGPGGRRSGAR